MLCLQNRVHSICQGAYPEPVGYPLPEGAYAVEFLESLRLMMEQICSNRVLAGMIFKVTCGQLCVVCEGICV